MAAESKTRASLERWARIAVVEAERSLQGKAPTLNVGNGKGELLRILVHALRGLVIKDIENKEPKNAVPK